VRPLSIIDAARQQTALDRIVELLKVGVSEDYASGAIGISATELRSWMRQAQALAEQYRHGRKWDTFRVEEQALIVFARDAHAALTDWVARQEAMLEQLVRGGHEVVELRERMQGNTVVERVEVRSRLAPNPAVLMWRLERRLPELYGKRTELLIHGDDTSSDDDVRHRLVQRLGEVAERLALPKPSPNGSPTTNGEHHD